ncbi:MAG: DUF2461 domain-containing protein [Paludibacter sp.]|nr:DUF2461 domain-containing protein [Paludibacter sp.]
MATTNILAFLRELKDNNNREWFAENKERYESTRKDFERISNALILKVSKFDDDIKHVTTKDCVFRIYRDTRFSHDKTPYKTHYGVFIAAGGGRKSVRGGYYFHLEPENCFIATGVWCPPPEILKALRQSVYDNIDEFKEITTRPDFSRYFNAFYQDDKLKTAPKGFPKDFPDIDLLKLKHYMVEYKLNESFLTQNDFVGKVAEIFKAAHPLNVFLNYTVDEVA